MSMIFSPDGILNVAADPSDLPESAGEGGSRSGAMVRAKNVRLNESGKAHARDGSTKLNAAAIEAAIWWIEEQAGIRYAFAGTKIYADEASITTGLTSAQWSAIKYNAFNDTTANIFALNGTDRKRVEASVAYEWGLAAPTVAPTVSSGQGDGLTGTYNAKYTYVRKVGSVIVAESNPSPSAALYVEGTNKSLAVTVTAPSDAQVTHIRLYRTFDNGVIYYLDQETTVAGYTHGVTQTWEDTDDRISGAAWKFTLTDATRNTENTYSWEEQPNLDINDNSGYARAGNWWEENDEAMSKYLAKLADLPNGLGGTPR